MAPTNLEFGPCSLGAPQPCPWESGSSHSATDMGCLPVCLILPSYNRITASSRCSIALGFPQGRDPWGLQCQTLSHSWWVQRSSCGTNCSSQTTEVQNNLPTQLTDPKPAEGPPSPNQEHSPGGGWGNTRMVPCIVLGCGRLCSPEQRCQGPLHAL